jgi:hypothetical protein
MALYNLSTVGLILDIFFKIANQKTQNKNKEISKVLSPS